MTALLDRAVAAVRRLLPRDQDEIARGLLEKARQPVSSASPDQSVNEPLAPAEADAFRL